MCSVTQPMASSHINTDSREEDTEEEDTEEEDTVIIKGSEFLRSAHEQFKSKYPNNTSVEFMGKEMNKIKEQVCINLLQQTNPVLR